MNEKNKINNYHEILRNFVEICNENKLWYSLANETLLSTKTKLNYYENFGILEVFVTNETYSFLKSKYKKNIIDFMCLDGFYLSTPFFYIENNNKFIKLIIIAPTTVGNIKKFYNIKNKIKYNYSNFLTFKNGYDIKTKFLFFWFKLFSIFCLPLENIIWHDSIYEKDFKGFSAINSLNEAPSLNWFPNLTFNVEKEDFLGLKVDIIKEFPLFLENRYGKKWKDGLEIKCLHFDYTELFNKINH